MLMKYRLNTCTGYIMVLIKYCLNTCTGYIILFSTPYTVLQVHKNAEYLQTQMVVYIVKSIYGTLQILYELNKLGKIHDIIWRVQISLTAQIVSLEAKGYNCVCKRLVVTPFCLSSNEMTHLLCTLCVSIELQTVYFIYLLFETGLHVYTLNWRNQDQKK